jgi:hypothetical protein
MIGRCGIWFLWVGIRRRGRGRIGWLRGVCGLSVNRYTLVNLLFCRFSILAMPL